MDALKQRRSSVSSQTTTTDVTGTIDQLHKRWQNLQRRPSEYYNLLQKEHERQEFIAVERFAKYSILLFNVCFSDYIVAIKLLSLW